MSDPPSEALRQEILENQRLIDELNKNLSRKTQEVRIIQEVSSEITATLDLDRIFAAILHAMDAVFGFKHSMILLLEAPGERLHVVASRGYDDAGTAGVGAEVPVGHGVIGMVAKKRRLMRVGGLQTQRAYVSAVRAQSGGGEDPLISLPGLQNAQSQVAIPLVTEDQLIGVFSVESPKPSVFDEKDEVLMGILASQAAGAIRNARLYREVQELNETLEERVRERTEDLRRTQAQLVQSEKMASLGMLVAGIAHEINTPLGSLHSTHDTLFRAADKLRELVEHELPEEARANPRLKTLFGVMSDARDVVRTSTGRVDGIVKRLKSFARLDEAELKEIDLHECIEDTLVLLHHELEGTRLVKSYAELPRITCFPGQLNQVLLNVILNARQAIVEGGEITVTTTREGDRARIDIRDDGVGIAPEALGRVFDPGYTTKGVGVGTGLGLAIAYRIVRDHRGDIRIASELGKGTTVTITLPFVSFGGSAPEPRELAPAE